jgi:rhodanese-related sulfurtransferase
VAGPVASPPTHKNIDTLLGEARTRLQRLDPARAQSAMAAGALLIDIRSDAERHSDGVVAEALVIERNVLEWRCDPACAWRDPRIDPARLLIVMCNEGYQSSLAAATLRDLGLDGATDLIGGFRAWRDAGLPVQPRTEETLMRAIECPCGHHLEGADDEELFRLARDHVNRHPEMERTDEQLRERIAADAHDCVPAAPVSAP